MKHEWRKTEKELYLPKSQPVKLELNPMQYLTVLGSGNPNGPAFSEAVGALYGLAYGIKMAVKKTSSLAGAEDYTVYPLEGFWWLGETQTAEIELPKSGPTDGLNDFDKNDLQFKLMIRQPDFVPQSLFKMVLEQVSKKKPNPYNAQVQFETLAEGLCVQILHKGSYDSEPASFEKLTTFCQQQHLTRSFSYHKEIYLTDPRKTEPEKNKTVLRWQVAAKK